MKLINKKTIDEIIKPLEIIGAVERAFHLYGKAAFVMPERFSFEHADMTFLYMPCFTDTVCGTKMLTLVPENRERGLPSIDGMVVLNHHETGQAIALLDGKSVTAWRTGATGALAARILSYENASCLGIVGCGVQGLYQGICISAVRKIKRIFLYDAFKSKASMNVFAEKLREACPEVEDIRICGDVATLVAESEIIVTTTFSKEPVLPEDKHLLEGKCYIAVGSYKPDMRELPDALFALEPEVYVDLMYACKESGDLSTRIEKGLLKEDRIKCLHQVLDGTVEKAGKRTVLFKTVGMALVDMVAAEYLYRKASELEKGTEVEF